MLMSNNRDWFFIMTEVSVTEANVNNEVRRLYETAFPREEQIPWEDLMVLVERLQLNFTAYYDEGALVGFTIVFSLKSFNWLWYFAVSQELRGKGIGQQILSQVLENYKDKTVILDMESPEQESDNQAVRRRRHAFYRRNGFSDTGVGRSFGGIDYTVMMMGDGNFTTNDYDQIIAELRSHWDHMPAPDNN